MPFKKGDKPTAKMLASREYGHNLFRLNCISKHVSYLCHKLQLKQQIDPLENLLETLRLQNKEVAIKKGVRVKA